MKKLIIFVPAYNAEKTIVSVFKRFPNQLIERASEILVIDNNSSDNTYNVIKNYKNASKIKKITVLRNKKNLGYGGSKKIAFLYAVDKGHDIFIMIHSDGQYPPEMALDMIKPIEQGKADLVIGSRTNKLKGGMKIWKLLGNRALTFIENLAFGLNLVEFHSGYKAYNVHALKKIPIELLNNDHIISSETIFLFKMKNFKIHEIKIPTYYSKDITECSFNTSIKYGKDVVKLISSYIFHKLGFNDKFFRL